MRHAPAHVRVGCAVRHASGRDLGEREGPILLFGRDEWQVSIPPWATIASIRVSLWPFEIALDEKGLDLTM